MLRIPNCPAASGLLLKYKHTTFSPWAGFLRLLGSQPPEGLTLAHWEERQDEEHFRRPGTDLNLIAKLQPDVRDSISPQEVA